MMPRWQLWIDCFYQQLARLHVVSEFSLCGTQLCHPQNKDSTIISNFLTKLRNLKKILKNNHPAYRISPCLALTDGRVCSRGKKCELQKFFFFFFFLKRNAISSWYDNSHCLWALWLSLGHVPDTHQFIQSSQQSCKVKSYSFSFLNNEEAEGFREKWLTGYTSFSVILFPPNRIITDIPIMKSL